MANGRVYRLALLSLMLSSDWLNGIRSESTTGETYETHLSTGTDTSPSTPDATTTTAKDDIYCDENYDCEDPFTMSSVQSLQMEACACRSSYMNTGKCCLSQWWIVGLAAAAGAVVLLAFVVAVGCCWSYKGKAKRATTDAGAAQQLSRKLQDDLDRLELRENQERSSSVNRDVIKTTVPGHSSPRVTQSAVHPSAAPVAAAAAAAAAGHAPSEHHVSSDAHSGAHPPHPGDNHSVSTAPPAAAAVVAAAAAQDTRRHDNDGIDHSDVTRHSEQRSDTGQLHRQGHGDADGFHDLSHSPEPDYSRHYDNRRTSRPVTNSSFVDPYFGASRTNPVYAAGDDDDDDSLEAYDDTAPPTRNNYNYYIPTTDYNNHHVINRPSFRY